MHKKDYNTWNNEKKYLNNKDVKLYFSEREIWWCSLGINIGVEIDGKNGKFERPVLVYKYISKDSLFVVPLTSKIRNDDYHAEIITNKVTSYVKISQIRVISSKRLLRKIDTLDTSQFLKIKEKLFHCLF